MSHPKPALEGPKSSWEGTVHLSPITEWMVDHNWKRKEIYKLLDPHMAHVTGHLLNQVGSKVSIDQKTTDPQFPGLQLLLGGAALDQLGCRGETGIPRPPCPSLRAPGQPVCLRAWATPLPPTGHMAPALSPELRRSHHWRHRPRWGPSRGSAGGQPQWMLQAGGLREDIRTEGGVLS